MLVLGWVTSMEDWALRTKATRFNITMKLEVQAEAHACVHHFDIDIGLSREPKKMTFSRMETFMSK